MKRISISFLMCLLMAGLDYGKEDAKRNIFKQGIVKWLTTNLNPFCKGGAMKRLLKPRVSKECGVLCFNH
jgi:hypothetical protein